MQLSGVYDAGCQLITEAAPAIGDEVVIPFVAELWGRMLVVWAATILPVDWTAAPRRAGRAAPRRAGRGGRGRVARGHRRSPGRLASGRACPGHLPRPVPGPGVERLEGRAESCS